MKNREGVNLKHLAIIADGNRRWANANGLPINMGYVQGLTIIENCCDWAIKNTIPYITVYCFSTENWNRPKNEVDLLMDLARWYFEDRREWYVSANIKVRFSGRRDRFDDDFLNKIIKMEEATSCCTSLTLTICVDYGGRDEIARAVASGAKTEEEISAIISNNTPDPDVILRTGGEQRLSNFLLWQSAYAELFFSQVLFPALEYEDLDAVLCEYKCRKRNYGH